MTISSEALDRLVSDHDALIEDAYTTAVATAFALDKSGSDNISLNEIPDDVLEVRLAELRAKLAFYDRKAREYLLVHPGHINLTSEVSRGYKRMVLRILLERGSVNTWALLRAYLVVEATVGMWRFNNAWGVIEDYLTTGGIHTIGGAGLPQLDN